MTRITRDMIVNERQRLSNAIDALRTASEELGAIVKQDKTIGELEDAETVVGWIAEIRDLSTVLDQAYGETFILEPDDGKDMMVAR